MYYHKVKLPRSNLLPLVLVIAGLLLVAGVVYWQVTRTARGKAAAVATETIAQENIPAPEIQRVSLEDAIDAYESKTAVFVDVRDADSYHQGHIPGAINIPLGQLESRAGELDANRWIITYCS